MGSTIAMLRESVNKKLNHLAVVLENKVCGVALKACFKVMDKAMKKAAPALKFVKRSTAFLKTANAAATAKFNQHVSAVYGEEHAKAKQESPHPADVVKLAMQHAAG